MLLEGGGEWKKGANQVLLLIQTDKILGTACSGYTLLEKRKRGKEEVVEQVKAGNERYLTVAPRCVGAQVGGGTS